MYFWISVPYLPIKKGFCKPLKNSSFLWEIQAYLICRTIHVHFLLKQTKETENKRNFEHDFFLTVHSDLDCRIVSKHFFKTSFLR